MKQPTIVALLFAVLLGMAAALFRPAAQPYQIAAVENNHNIFMVHSSSASFDAGLDNEDIQADTNISPSRKCGFCMG